jgi:hypothetical protein
MLFAKQRQQRRKDSYLRRSLERSPERSPNVVEANDITMPWIGALNLVSGVSLNEVQIGEEMITKTFADAIVKIKDLINYGGPKPASVGLLKKPKTDLLEKKCCSPK